MAPGHEPAGMRSPHVRRGRARASSHTSTARRLSKRHRSPASSPGTKITSRELVRGMQSGRALRMGVEAQEIDLQSHGALSLGIPRRHWLCHPGLGADRSRPRTPSSPACESHDAAGCGFGRVRYLPLRRATCHPARTPAPTWCSQRISRPSEHVVASFASHLRSDTPRVSRESRTAAGCTILNRCSFPPDAGTHLTLAHCSLTEQSRATPPGSTTRCRKIRGQSRIGRRRADSR